MTDQDLEMSLRPELDEALLGLDELALENPEEALSMFETLPEPVQALPEFQLALARTHQLLGQLEAARDIALGVVNQERVASDAHHLLGDLLEDLGDGDAANEHFLEVLKLDRQSFEEECSLSESELRERLNSILQSTIEALPEEIRGQVQAATCKIELFPTATEVKAGLDPRALAHWHQEGEQAGHFVLYGANLDAEFGDLTEFDEFSPHVRAAIHDEIIEGLELSAADSKRFGLLTELEDE